ncbi:MAG: acylneuraminate cytidylyltransferase family protein [Candidatus Altiarchaeales archaeon]|nr:acylneuraminate cytidylyltransferase family protein [Candidatus Altiarchaeales archaeon]
MVVFVPLKKESQRVPGKNFRDFGGIPLYKHVLMKYRDLSVFVDTDNPDVLKMIKQDEDLQHVEVYLRKENLKGHDVSVNLLIDYFLTVCKQECIYAQVHVTNPFLKPETVVHAAESIGESFDSVCSADRIQARCWRMEANRSIPINHNPSVLEQTQDINPVFVENSCFYLFTRDSFLGNGRNRVGKKPLFCETAYPQNLDIDTEEDWDRCLRVLKEEDEQ